MKRKLIYLREEPQWKEKAAKWFCSKWSVPEEAYLPTDHTAFYDRYGWSFLCMVQEDGGGTAEIYHRKCN